MNYKVYIDFDGVILDTWNFIFSKYVEKYKTEEILEYKIKQIMTELGWSQILKNSDVIQDSISKIQKLIEKYEVFILTKINSLEESIEKEKFLHNYGIYKIICVPYEDNKSDFVNPMNSILIDDDLNNLDDWAKKGGKSLFFQKDLKSIDSYGRVNTKYKIINNLEQINDIINSSSI